MNETDLPPDALLALLRLPGVGRTTARRIIARLSEMPSVASELLHALRSLGGSVPRFRAPDLDVIERVLCDVQATIARCGDEQIEILSVGDSRFPARLLLSDDHPLVLFAKGNLSALSSQVAVAVIGSRAASGQALAAARRIGEALASQGVVVVSGLAAGCDAEAHWGVVQGRGVGVGVLAHGLDTISPASSRSLSEKLLECDGCLASEYPPGEPPRKRYYVDRDRIQSGLSCGVVLVEAMTGSGSMHTIGFAETQRRPIACVEYTSPEPMGTANEELLKNARATAVRTPEEVLAWCTNHLHDRNNST